MTFVGDLKLHHYHSSSSLKKSKIYVVGCSSFHFAVSTNECLFLEQTKLTLNPLHASH